MSNTSIVIFVLSVLDSAGAAKMVHLFQLLLFDCEDSACSLEASACIYIFTCTRDLHLMIIVTQQYWKKFSFQD